MPLDPAARTSLAAEPGIALGPLDGRYRSDVAPLVDFLSEAALNRARLAVEVEWIIHLTESGAIPGAPRLTPAEQQYLRDVVATFGPAEIAELAEIEAETRHDVKAVEYFLKRRMERAADSLGAETALPAASELAHIFCTSEDINNLSYALTIRDAVQEVWLPAARRLVDDLAAVAREHAATPMLARTHGQPATPVTLGKELAVVVHRLRRQIARIERDEVLGKINGATGTYGAHAISVPGTDWERVAREFVTGLGLVWNPLTTQIESHDWQSELYDDIARFNRVLHNFATDVWTYISLGYFVQNLSAQGSTGSSTMPHKVNPIRFENGEANLEVSSALLANLSATLVTSRLQRDLTDSSTQRTIGIALGHSLLAISNITRGLAGLGVDAAAMARDLDANWEVLGEAVQSAMRAAGIAGAAGMADPYERLKELTRGRRVDGAGMREFIVGLGLPDEVQERLVALAPADYTGYSERLVAYLD